MSDKPDAALLADIDTYLSNQPVSWALMDLIKRVRVALAGAAGREHVTSAACWCEPQIEYRDPETGAAVYVHKEIQ